MREAAPVRWRAASRAERRARGAARGQAGANGCPAGGAATAAWCGPRRATPPALAAVAVADGRSSAHAAGVASLAPNRRARPIVTRFPPAERRSGCGRAGRAARAVSIARAAVLIEPPAQPHCRCSLLSRRRVEGWPSLTRKEVPVAMAAALSSFYEHLQHHDFEFGSQMEEVIKAVLYPRGCYLTDASRLKKSFYRVNLK